jgi:phosphopantothenoylcysteine decarboxylase / phosphopantothenate---cysteine ligase
MSRIVLGVSAGIAAYKACLLLRRFAEAGHDVEVVPTANSLNFVGLTTWAALSGRPVHTDVFAEAEQVNHVRIGREAQLVIVAPTTADLLARAASGRADDLLTNVLLTATCPVVFAPAMHTEMWLHPATQANVATLRARGSVVIEPATGRLTGPDNGPGRLPEPEDLEATVLAVLAEPSRAAQLAAQDLAGVQVLISAGGTREALDPVRFLGNESSGLMGVALARAAASRGARVQVVAAHVSTSMPAGVEVCSVRSAAELSAAMTEAAPQADLIVMAAAVADFAPASISESKIKKKAEAGLSLDLVQTQDILAGLAAARPAGQVVVGFAAETAGSEAELLALGQAKLARKGCQLLVLNDVSGGAVFGAADNEVIMVSSAGVLGRASGTKTAVAHAILDAAKNVRERNNP